MLSCLLQSIIPMPLIMSVEFIKFCQIILMQWDLKLYYERKDYPLLCRAWNINEVYLHSSPLILHASFMRPTL